MSHLLQRLLFLLKSHTFFYHSGEEDDDTLLEKLQAQILKNLQVRYSEFESIHRVQKYLNEIILYLTLIQTVKVFFIGLT